MKGSESRPLERQHAIVMIQGESRRMMAWVVAACALFSLHTLQVVLLGQAWKNDLSGWAFIDSPANGSGWALLSVLVLVVCIATMTGGLVEQSSRLLGAVAGLSALRLVLVVVSTFQANNAGLESRFGIALTVLALVLTMVVAGHAATLD